MTYFPIRTLSSNEMLLDPRQKAAQLFFAECDNPVSLLYKTTRAGCTTSLITECVRRGETFLAVVPTNKIAQKTIIKDVKKHCMKYNLHIIQVAANKLCILNQQKCKQYPELDDLPFLPLPMKCKECTHFSKCPVTRILSAEDFDGIVITYDKLVSLILASIVSNNSTADSIIDKLISVDNIILDEVHTIQYGKTRSLGLYAISDLEPVIMIDFQKYSFLESNFKHLHRLVTNFNELLSNPSFISKIHMLLAVVSDSLEDSKHVDISDDHQSILCNNMSRSNREYFGAYSEIISLTQNCSKYGLSIQDILKLEKMLSIVHSANLVLKRFDNDSYSTVDVVAVKHIHKLMLKQFCSMVKGKRLVMTSATICSFDYSFLFDEGVSIKQSMFGPSGDPMDTNSKTLILADKKKYHATGDRSISKNMSEIVSNIIKILAYWGIDNCLIITINNQAARKIQEALKEAGLNKEVMYYNSSDTIGVSSDARVMIAVGFAYKPSDAYDLVTSDKEKSNILREESVHCDTWQALSRVKDPNAKIPSVVFAFGCTEMDCRNVVTWGTDRNVNIEYGSNGRARHVDVTITSSVSKPAIKKCKSFDTMLLEAAIHTQNKKIISDRLIKPLFNTISININSGFNCISNTIYTKSEFLKLIANEKGRYYDFNDSEYIPTKSSSIDDTLIEYHLKGDIVLSTHTLSEGNKVKWICLIINNTTKVEDNNVTVEVLRLRNFFTVCDIPFILESCNDYDSYRFWIFLMPIEARVAKNFGKWIKEQSGVQCEIYPKQMISNRKGPGDLVLLPFAIGQGSCTDSKIWINNSFREFEGLEVGVIDVSVFGADIRNPSADALSELADFRSEFRPLNDINIEVG